VIPPQSPQQPVLLTLAHASPDRLLAQQLADFLKLGCDVRCQDLDASVLGAGEHILDLAPSHDDPAQITLLLLSPHSWPERLPRERWESLLGAENLGWVLLAACPYPGILERRPTFFNPASHEVRAWRAVKRWIWGGAGQHQTWSADLEELYGSLADVPGMVFEASAEIAQRFAREAAGEFESVCRIPCHHPFRGTLAQVAGSLGAHLGLTLDGPLHENLERLRAELTRRRCLIVLESPDGPVREMFEIGGEGRRASVLIAPAMDAGAAATAPSAEEYAAQLIRARRYAEAHEILSAVMGRGDAFHTAACARDLAWICDHWGYTEEAEHLRRFDVPAPSYQGGLFD
jgi:hypothetical protein